jgi:hypothetical protein
MPLTRRFVTTPFYRGWEALSNVALPARKNRCPAKRVGSPEKLLEKLPKFCHASILARVSINLPPAPAFVGW